MDDSVDVLASRTPEGIGFSFKVRATGRLYRLEPARDPREPRYWCFRIYRCLPGGRGDPAERPWLGGSSMTRSELAEATAAIRADLGGWLAQESLGELRQWVLAEPPPVLDGDGSLKPRVAPRSRGESTSVAAAARTEAMMADEVVAERVPGASV
jgi:hypothetical protein